MDAPARLRLLELRDKALINLAAARLKHRAALHGDRLDLAFAGMWAEVVRRAESSLAEANAALANLPQKDAA